MRLESLASEHPRVFVRLLERAMRDQAEKSEDAPPKSVEELQQALRERARGPLPVNRGDSR